MAKFVRNLTVQRGLIVSGTEDVIGAGDLPASGATAGTYGDASHTLTVTVDVAGRITAIATNVISAGMANPMTTLGDIIYESATPAPARLAGNTTTTRKFLRQVGTGTVSAAPTWDTLVVGDLPPYSGEILGFSYVATDESASTGSPVSLTTPDSVTFTLTQTQNILVDYLANMYASAAGYPNQGTVTIFLDGVATSLVASANILVANANQLFGLRGTLSSVAAGSHTISARYNVQAGSVAVHWLNRALTATILS